MWLLCSSLECPKRQGNARGVINKGEMIRLVYTDIYDPVRINAWRCQKITRLMWDGGFCCSGGCGGTLEEWDIHLTRLWVDDQDLGSVLDTLAMAGSKLGVSAITKSG